MQDNGYGEFMDKLKQVVAENQSLTARLGECTQIIRAKEGEIAMLHQMLAEAGAAQSHMDSKVEEMNYLQDYISEMKQVMASVSFNGTGMPQAAPQNSEAAAEMEEMQELNTYQQIQLRDLKEQLKELKSRNSMLEEKAARAAELESLLANITEERDQWKNFVMNKG